MSRKGIRRLAASMIFMVVVSCGSKDPTSSADASSGRSLVVGSQAYYSNEILAEVFSQALEAEGFKVNRQFSIGQREVYLPELEAGKIDVFPEYIGSLLQAIEPKAKGRSSEEVVELLNAALPSRLDAIAPAEAADQNSWTVTASFAAKYNLTDLASLKNVTEPIFIGGNSELETRPYGPAALRERYGVPIAGFKVVEDNGGPLTVKALTDGAIQLANIYTADPNIRANNLVALEDPDGLFLPDNVTAVVSNRVGDDARAVLQKVAAALSQDALLSMNGQSVRERKSAKDNAASWLAFVGLN
jgi:osmoprotectant transport system substrate-binding protein